MTRTRSAQTNAVLQAGPLELSKLHLEQIPGPVPESLVNPEQTDPLGGRWYGIFHELGTRFYSVRRRPRHRDVRAYTDTDIQRPED